jgi:hypothetical protein
MKRRVSRVFAWEMWGFIEIYVDVGEEHGFEV